MNRGSSSRLRLMGNSWWLKANPRGILLGVCDEARVEHRARRLGSPRGLGDSRGLCHRWKKKKEKPLSPCIAMS